MKKIEALIRSDKLDQVKEALIDLGHAGLTVLEARGHGIQKGVTQKWRGKDYVVDLLPKLYLMIVVHDHESADVVDAIAHAARTGYIGDGKIFVSTVDEVVRIRTGELGAEAV